MMKDLRRQVPETLTGVFGIDFIGRVVGQVTGVLYVVLVLGAVGGSYLGAGMLPDAFTFTFSENPMDRTARLERAAPYRGRLRWEGGGGDLRADRYVGQGNLFYHFLHADHPSGSDCRRPAVSARPVPADGGGTGGLVEGGRGALGLSSGPIRQSAGRGRSSTPSIGYDVSRETATTSSKSRGSMIGRASRCCWRYRYTFFGSVPCARRTYFRKSCSIR